MNFGEYITRSYESPHWGQNKLFFVSRLCDFALSDSNRSKNKAVKRVNSWSRFNRDSR